MNIINKINTNIKNSDIRKVFAIKGEDKILIESADTGVVNPTIYLTNSALQFNGQISNAQVIMKFDAEAVIGSGFPSLKFHFQNINQGLL